MSLPGSASARGVRAIERGERLGVRRGEPVVIVPVFGAADVTWRCLESIFRHTAADVPILIADDASPGAEIAELIESLSRRPGVEHSVAVLRQPVNLGFVGNVNAGFSASAPGDAVIVNSDCVVGPEWLGRLRAAAYCDSNIATATALTNQGTILSLLGWSAGRSNPPEPDGIDEFARELARVSPKLRPRIPTAIGHCFYVRRDALDLVGEFDPAFAPGYGEEVDFSQRCILQGLSHVAADDVFVYHAGSSSFGQTAIQAEHEQLLLHRYPYYHRAVREAADSDVGPLHRALSGAMRIGAPLTVTIDGRCLGPTMTGTQLHVLELTAALWRTGQVQLRIVVPPDVGNWALDGLAPLTGITVLRSDELDGDTERTQLVHRPYQIFHLSDLPALAALGERVVITQQDMIAYRNPGYARSTEDWFELHRLTRLTLGYADSVLFFSEHARQDTLAEGLIDEARSHVVHLGVDHHAVHASAEVLRPEQLPAGADGAYLVCLGTNFRHKNRVFALKVLEQLQARHGWDGWLVFAGPHAASGTSEAEEAGHLADRPSVAERVVDLGEITEPEKTWLLRNTAGVLYPSVYEGFGLVPFEAAEAGAPCFYAWHTALAETLPPSTAVIVPWDAAATADAIAAVLADLEGGRALALAIRAAGQRLRWDRTAVEVLHAYHAMLRRPPRQLAVALEGTASPWDIGPVGIDALGRIGLPRGAYRALLAILARPRFKTVFCLLLGAFFRVGYFARHGRLPRD